MDVVDPHRIDEAEARRMTRWQALKALEVAGDESDRHMARLMLAGPDISDEEAEQLRGRTMRLKPLVWPVRNALAEMGGWR